MTLRGTAAAIALTVVAVGPAAATHEGIHPSFRSERSYFDCSEPVGALGGWSPEPPGSLAEGEGCASGLGGSPTLCAVLRICGGGVTYRGTFVGNIRDLTVQLHLRPTVPLWISNARPFVPRLRVDDEPIPLPSTFVPSAPVGSSETYRFSIASLGCAMEAPGADGTIEVTTDGLATEDGPGSVAHTIELFVEIDSFEPSGVWVWGASEFPAQITFNPGSLPQPRIQPEDPADCG